MMNGVYLPNFSMATGDLLRAIEHSGSVKQTSRDGPGEYYAMSMATKKLAEEVMESAIIVIPLTAPRARWRSTGFHLCRRRGLHVFSGTSHPAAKVHLRTLRCILCKMLLIDQWMSEPSSSFYLLLATLWRRRSWQHQFEQCEERRWICRCSKLRKNVSAFASWRSWVSWRKRQDQDQKVCLITFWILLGRKCSLEIRRILLREKGILGSVQWIKQKWIIAYLRTFCCKERCTFLCYVSR
jgi:hypothetical protein